MTTLSAAEMHWTEPPLDQVNSVYGRRRAFVALLETRPGEWAVYPWGSSHAGGTDFKVRYPGTEATVRRDPARDVAGKKGYTTYVRWVGVAQPDGAAA